MTIAASVLLLLLAVAVYVRHLRVAWWLLLLRLVVLGLLVLVLLDAVISRHWPVRSDRVIVLVDQSQSMGRRGLDTLATSAAGRFPVPEQMRRETRWFAGDSAPAGDEPANPDRTRIAAALEAATRVRPATIVLVSDGQDNGELDPVETARRLGIPVYTVGCGLGSDRNVAAEQVAFPAEVYVGDTVEALARISYRGLGGEQASIRLDNDTRSVTLADEAAEQEITFSKVFAQAGRFVVRFAVDSVPGESDWLDNELLAAVEVKPARTRVRYLTDRPHDGTRFVTRVLEADPRVDLGTSIVLRPGEPLSAGEADVYILDNLAGNDGLVRQVARAVEDGAGALVIAGPESRFGPGFEELLPGAGGPARTGEFPVVLTSAGRLHSWLAGIETDDLPPLAGLFRDGQADEIWMSAGAESLPVVQARRTGRGRAVLVAGFPVWRWGFRVRPPGGTDPLQLLVLGVVRYLSAAGQEQFRLFPEREAFHRDEPVRVRLSARTEDGSAWSGLDVRLNLDTLDATVPMIETRAGEYEAELAVAVAGTHQVAAEVRADDSLVGRAVTEVAVLDRSLELSRTGLNRGLLERVAAASGGEYFDCDELPGTGFEPRTKTWQRGFRFEPRRTPWVYVLIALLFCLEWVLRRRQGLL